MNIENKEAKQIIEDYFHTFPGVKAYMEKSKEIVRKKAMPKPSFTVAAICRTSTVTMALCVDLPNAMPSMLLSRVPRPTLSKWLWCASSNASRLKTSRANDHPGTRRTQLLCLSRRERESRANRSRGNAECLSTERAFGSRCRLGKQLARSSLKHSYHYIPVVPHETTGMLLSTNTASQ